MQITIRTHHVDITPALKEYTQKKVEKLEKYFENTQEILIELDVVDTADNNKSQVASGHIKASQATLFAEESSKDMYASIDLLMEKLEIQLRKHKEKLRSHKKESMKRTISEIRDTATGSGKKQVAISDDEKLYIAKPMTAEEAADILELEKTKFLMFRNSVTEEINVIYPVKAGVYGLIEP